jgi:tetratricopeptide (TPR) repeat protein
VRPLLPSGQCDEVIPLKSAACRRCGRELSGEDAAPLRHQVWELPEIKPQVVEYQRHRLACPGCGETTCATLPLGVPTGQSGPRLVAFAGLLMAYFRQSKRRAALFLEMLLNQASYRAALGLYQQLTAEFPTVPNYRQELARTHSNLGTVLDRTGRPQQAEAAYRAALDVQKALAGDFPAMPSYRHLLAVTHTNLGILLRDTARPQEAEGAYRNALDILKPLVAVFPHVPEYHSDVGNTLDELAELARRRKDYPAARRLLEEAEPYLKKALEADPRHPFYREVYSDTRRVLGATLLELGDHTGAAEAAAELARVSSEPANDAYKAACFLARCIPLAEKDAKLPQARRQELTKSYGDRAVQALRQALAHGYRDAAHMQKDTDLDPLRGRDDFQKLLAELDKGAGKGKPSDDRPQR